MEEMPGTFVGDLGYQVLIAVLAGIVLALLAVLWRTGFLRRLLEWREARAFRKAAPWITTELLSYMTHLRDIGRTFRRARSDTPDEINERIRREILEPVRAILSTGPGEEIKIVWFRPHPDGKHLAMYEQVGHSEEGQRGLRLRIGGSIAGKCFIDNEVVYAPDCEQEDSFESVEHGKATGSLACVPITQGDDVTGVLSVLASWTDAFWLSEIVYFEALASAIAALETPADTTPETGTDERSGNSEESGTE